MNQLDLLYAIEVANMALGGYLSDSSYIGLPDRDFSIVQGIKYNNEAWLADTSRPLVLAGDSNIRAIFQVSPGKIGYQLADGTWVDASGSYIDGGGRVIVQTRLNDFVGPIEQDPAIQSGQAKGIDDFSVAWGIGVEPLQTILTANAGSSGAGGSGGSSSGSSVGTTAVNDLTYDSYDFQGPTPIIGGGGSTPAVSSETTITSSTYGTSEGE